MSSEEMFELLEKKREKVLQDLDILPEVTVCGFIDTSHGFNLTSDKAIALAMRIEHARSRKYAKKEERKLQAEARFAVAKEQKGKRRQTKLSTNAHTLEEPGGSKYNFK